MKTYLTALCTWLLMAGTNIGAKASNTLQANQAIERGQYIQSAEQKYHLAMQTDGNLVMYRQDGTVRYVAGSGGQMAVMQGDGNFVEYSPFGVAVWNTKTSGNPGAFLAIQDDGNLVVYGATGPLWNIGAEPDATHPSIPGDVVGRDFLQDGLGWIGHIGIWDGKNVVEAAKRGSGVNAIAYVSKNSFINAMTGYWGRARAKVPDRVINRWCYELFCDDFGANYYYFNAHDAMSRRAYQIYRIGAEYTFYAGSTSPSLPATARVSARRGTYRCDTFVLDVLRRSTDYVYNGPDESQWKSRFSNMEAGPITPPNIFKVMNTFN